MTKEKSSALTPFRWLLLMICIFTLCFTFITGSTGFVVQVATNKITSQDITASLLGNRPKKPETHAETLNILIIGSDTREGQGDNFGDAEAFGTIGRSDSTILIHLPEDRSRLEIINIPRDTLVDIPACKNDSGGEYAPRKDRFNSAFAFGGVACTIQTIEKMTGVFIDHYAVINFKGFQKIIDTIGGVNLCIARTLKDEQAKLDLQPGNQIVNGAQALALMRARKKIGDGSDLQRIDRQQVVMGAIAKKITSLNILANPIKLSRTLNTIASHLTTDAALAKNNYLINLGLSMFGIKLNEITFIRVPTVYNKDFSTVSLHSSANSLWESLKNDEPWIEPETPEYEIQSVFKPSKIKVSVYNGTSINKYASRYLKQLSKLGFMKGETDNWSTKPVIKTHIVYPAGEHTNASALAKWFGEIQIKKSVDPTIQNISVVLGIDNPVLSKPQKNKTVTIEKETQEGITFANDKQCIG